MLEKVIQLAKGFESLHDGDLSQIGLQPKMCPAGIWTEGYGKAMRYKGKFLKGIENKELAYSLITIHDEAEALVDLRNRFNKNEVAVRKLVKVQLNDNQIGALCLNVDNCGVSETLFKLVNTRSFNSIEIKRWWTEHYITSEGMVQPGLVRRRRTEYELFVDKNCQDEK